MNINNKVSHVGASPNIFTGKLNEYNKQFYLIMEHFKEGMTSNEDIELVSLTHFRGRTFENSVCIIDEFQNLSKQQLSMCLSRLGKGSTMIFTGDSQQIDLKFKNDSAIHEVAKVQGSDFVNKTVLKENHRHEALDSIFELLKDYS